MIKNRSLCSTYTNFGRHGFYLPSLQAVSPGCVRTELVGRMRGVDDIDEFKKNAFVDSAVSQLRIHDHALHEGS